MAVADPRVLVVFFITTLAMTSRPRMSIPGAPPTMMSTRSTWSDGMRARMVERVSVLEVGGLPSISTLPTVPPRPRRSRMSSKLKPGSHLIMSMAVAGRTGVKNSGL